VTPAAGVVLVNVDVGAAATCENSRIRSSTLRVRVLKCALHSDKAARQGGGHRGDIGGALLCLLLIRSVILTLGPADS
jgi:hypothetical protein